MCYNNIYYHLQHNQLPNNANGWLENRERYKILKKVTRAVYSQQSDGTTEKQNKEPIWDWVEGGGRKRKGMVTRKGKALLHICSHSSNCQLRMEKGRRKRKGRESSQPAHICIIFLQKMILRQDPKWMKMVAGFAGEPIQQHFPQNIWLPARPPVWPQNLASPKCLGKLIPLVFLV